MAQHRTARDRRCFEDGVFIVPSACVLSVVCQPVPNRPLRAGRRLMKRVSVSWRQLQWHNLTTGEQEQGKSSASFRCPTQGRRSRYSFVAFQHCCAWGCCPLHASGGREQRASGSPSPPLEERVGERRPITLLVATVRGDLPAGRRINISGVLAENDDLLSLPLSSKGGEGNGATVGEHREAWKEHRARAHSAKAISRWHQMPRQ